MKCPACGKEVKSLMSIKVPGGEESKSICSKCFERRFMALLAKGKVKP